MLLQIWSILERLITFITDVGILRFMNVGFLVGFEILHRTFPTKHLRTTFTLSDWFFVLLKCTRVLTFKVTVFTFQNLCVFNREFISCFNKLFRLTWRLRSIPSTLAYKSSWDIACLTAFAQVSGVTFFITSLALVNTNCRVFWLLHFPTSALTSA